MKKKFIFMTMIAMLLAALIAPATAAAAGPKTGEDFTAGAPVIVTGMQMHHTAMSGVDIAVHEIVVSPYDPTIDPIFYSITSDWDAINGGMISGDLTGVAKPVIGEDGLFHLVGSTTGSFTVLSSSGDTLSGHMWINVDATLGFDENSEIIITEINDTGTFKINNGTGELKGTKASGNLSATLFPVTVPDPTTGEMVDTFAGVILMDGQYR